MTGKPLARLTSRLMEACITGATIGIAEYITSSAIRSMREIGLRSAVLVATPIAVAISLAIRSLLNKMKGSAPRPDSLTAAKLQPQGRDHSETIPDNYMTEVWAAQLWVSGRPGVQLPPEDGGAPEDSHMNERQR